MKKLNRLVKVYPEFAPSEWRLYPSSESSEGTQKLNEAAIALNKALRDAVNKKGSTRSSVAIAMRKILSNYSEFGGQEIELWHFLLDILDIVYGP
jgi:hypothetical protein